MIVTIFCSKLGIITKPLYCAVACSCNEAVFYALDLVIDSLFQLLKRGVIG